ncbi:biotin transporter BioY [Trueperella sp. LYQ143]|uniref:biotin transporter BioY n=1 Tax=Trueperella sp. LYQ143 TaxID=3391059 RepID=UPI003982D8AC
MTVLSIRPVLADTWVPRASLVRDIALSVTGAIAVGVLAQVSVPVWPVPITGQTLGVMVVGAALGARRGAHALLLYLLLGLAGMPWFANFTGGMAAIAKPSFGFIIGFIPTAYVIGRLAERRWDRHQWLSFAAFGIASVIPFLFGVPYMWWMLHQAGTTLSLAATLNTGVTPFILGGVVKMILGVAIISALWRFTTPTHRR